MSSDPREDLHDMLALFEAGRATAHLVGMNASQTVSRPDTSFADHPEVVRVRDRYGELPHLYNDSEAAGPPVPSRAGSDKVPARHGKRELIDFSTISYLNLASDPRVITAAKAAIDAYGTSASVSQIASGEIPLFGELETRLARRYGVDAAVVTPSGFMTNAAVIGYVLGSKDLAVCDALVHSSVISGTRWAGCTRLTFDHNDPASLEAVLQTCRGSFSRALVIVEGCYSMDGDIARLPEIIATARHYHCSIMVDEAHSFGVLGPTGRGVQEYFGLSGDAADIWVGSLSLALGSVGGFGAGNAELMRALKYAAPGVSLSTSARPPSPIGAALEALKILDSEPERVRRLQHNGRVLRALAKLHGFDTGLSDGTAIVPISRCQN